MSRKTVADLLVASRARRVTDAMLQAAARALAVNSPALKDPSASLLSSLKDSRRVATEDELRQRVSETQWTPAYPNLKGELR